MLTKEDFLVAPWPVTNNGKRDVSTCSSGDWAEKIYEETDEAVTACADDSPLRAAEEIVDSMTVCVSWLHARGFNNGDICDMIRFVNLKNRERGYCKK